MKKSQNREFIEKKMGEKKSQNREMKSWSNSNGKLKNYGE